MHTELVRVDGHIVGEDDELGAQSIDSEPEFDVGVGYSHRCRGAASPVHSVQRRQRGSSCFSPSNSYAVLPSQD